MSLMKVTFAGDEQALFNIEARELLTFPEVLSLVKARTNLLSLLSSSEIVSSSLSLTIADVSS